MAGEIIKKSFIFLDKIGAKKEQGIWSRGIMDWDSFVKAESVKGISKKAKAYYNRKLVQASKALVKNNSSFFMGMPSREMWRLYSAFKDSAVFIDIEATGVTNKDSIFSVSIYNGLETKTMVKGINLDFDALKKELEKHKLIITFNGSSFDLPFIKKRHNISISVPHIDVMHVCRKIGLTGGLKAIEKRLGIKRNRIISNLYGGDVLRLWRMFSATGDTYYLNLLTEYNEDDVLNLKKIVEYATTKLEKRIEKLQRHKKVL